MESVTCLELLFLWKADIFEGQTEYIENLGMPFQSCFSSGIGAGSPYHSGRICFDLAPKTYDWRRRVNRVYGSQKPYLAKKSKTASACSRQLSTLSSLLSALVVTSVQVFDLHSNREHNNELQDKTWRRKRREGERWGSSGWRHSLLITHSLSLSHTTQVGLRISSLLQNKSLKFTGSLLSVPSALAVPNLLYCYSRETRHESYIKLARIRSFLPHELSTRTKEQR